MLINPYIQKEHQALFDMVYKFSKEQVLATTLDRDKNTIWDTKLWQELAGLGIVGCGVPESYGGQGLNCLETCLVSEALHGGSADGGFGLAWGAHAIIGTMPIVLFGTEEQKKKYLPKLANGECIAGLGLTEPGSGSDAAALSTTAIEKDDHYVLNGSKMFITNGPVGDVFIVMARTKPGKSRSPIGISAFIVEKSFPGFSVGKELEKLGMCSSTTSELIFEEMIVPKENVLGKLHTGFLQIGKATLEWERTVLISAMLGLMDFNLRTVLRYTQEREAFGKAIIDFDANQDKIAKNWVILQAARRYVYYVAQRKDQGESMPVQAAILKQICTEPAEIIAKEGVQALGGYGYMREYHLERIYRDTKLSTIGAGSSEVMRGIIASSYKNYENFSDMIHDLRDDNTSISIENIKAETVDVTLLKKLTELIKILSTDIKKHRNQNIQFAFSDLIVLTSTLWQTYFDIFSTNSTYSEQSKRRDFYLLIYYKIDMLNRSLQKLSSLCPDQVKEIFTLYCELNEASQKISSLVHELVSLEKAS